jgi:hypothetical protein
MTDTLARHRIAWFCDTDWLASNLGVLGTLRDEVGLTTLAPESHLCHTSGFAPSPEVVAASPLERWRESPTLQRHRVGFNVPEPAFAVLPGVVSGHDDGPLRRVVDEARRLGLEVWGHAGLWCYGGDALVDQEGVDEDAPEVGVPLHPVRRRHPVLRALRGPPPVVAERAEQAVGVGRRGHHGVARGREHRRGRGARWGQGHQGDVGRGRVAAQPPGELCPVEPGHGQVEQHQVRVHPGGRFDGLLGRVHGRGGEVRLLGQQRGDQLADDPLVGDQQDQPLAHAPPLSAGRAHRCATARSSGI